MHRVVFLDSSPLGLLCHPRPYQDVVDWMFRLLRRDIQVVVPEIIDYEVRRELIRGRKNKSISRLNQLKQDAFYHPITTDAMLKAAELWALARAHGKPTADHHALDVDVILAAQALTYETNAKDVVVATDNISHVSRFVAAQTWDSIS